MAATIPGPRAVLTGLVRVATPPYVSKSIYHGLEAASTCALPPAYVSIASTRRSVRRLLPHTGCRATALTSSSITMLIAPKDEHLARAITRTSAR